MKSTLLSCLAFVLTFPWALESHAVQIKLDKPIKYRKVEYQEFDTDEVFLALLLHIIKERAKTEPLVVATIQDAIANRQYLTHPNMIYFHPPLAYDGELLYQRYPYAKEKEAVEDLRAILKAAQESPNQKHYEKQIKRLKGILKSRDATAAKEEQEEGEEKSAPRKRGRPKKDKMEEPAEEPRQKAKLDEDELAPANNNVPRDEQLAPVPLEAEIPAFGHFIDLPPDWFVDSALFNFDPLM